MILGQETSQEYQGDSLKSYRHVKKTALSHEMKRYNRGVSPRGNGNCEAEMSNELCIVRTVRARKGAQWVRVLE